MVLLAKEAKTLELPEDFIWKLVDDGAPYSGLGLRESKFLKLLLLPDWDGYLEPPLESTKDRPYWPYGAENHASSSRRTIVSVLFSLRSDNGNTINIRHLVIAGTPQWVICQNVTRARDIKLIGANKLGLPEQCESTGQDAISMICHDLYSYLTYEEFFSSYSSFSSARIKSTVFRTLCEKPVSSCAGGPCTT